MALDDAGPDTVPVVKTSWVADWALLVRLKVAVPLTPDVVAVTVYGPPATVLAVKTDDVARPLELVVTTHSLVVGLPPEHEAKVPDGPK